MTIKKFLAKVEALQCSGPAFSIHANKKELLAAVPTLCRLVRCFAGYADGRMDAMDVANCQRDIDAILQEAYGGEFCNLEKGETTC